MAQQQQQQQQQGEHPVLRWPAITQPLPSSYLSLPLPPLPTATRALRADELQQAAVADQGALASAIAALQAVDLGYL